MKTKNIVLYILFSIISLSVFSQNQNLPINDFLQYKFEKQHLQSPNFHSDIKPYKIDSLFENTINYSVYKKIKKISLSNYFEIKPLKTLSIGYDIKNKNIIINSVYGLNLSGNYKKNFSFNLDCFLSIYHDSNLPDSMKIIPHFGLNKYKFHNTIFWLSTTGYLNYSPAEYIDFEVGRGKNF